MGEDTIYLGAFDEKTESAEIYIPRDLDTGSYKFYVEVGHEEYYALSYRTVYIEKGEDEIKVTMVQVPTLELDKDRPYTIYLYIIMFVIVSVLSFTIPPYLRRRKAKKEIEDIAKRLDKIKTTLDKFKETTGKQK
jgi:hypothetical protein